MPCPDPAGPLGGASQSGGFRTTDLDNNGSYIVRDADAVLDLVPEVTHEIVGTLNHSAGHSVPGNSAQDWNAGMLIPNRVVAPAHAPSSAEGSFPWPQEVADPLTLNEAKTYTHEGTTFRTRNVVPPVVDADEPSLEPQGFYTTDGRFNGIPPAGLSPPLKVGTGTGGTGNTDAAYLVRAEGADDPPAYCYPDADQLGYAPEEAPGDAPASTPVQAPFVFDTTQVTHPANFSSPKPGDPSHPLAAAGHAPTLVQAVPAYAVALRGREGGNTAELGGEIQPALRTGGGGSDKPHVLAGAHPRMVVRRLTPRECERLQGFPDDWTLIPWKNKPAVDCPDGPRYKALGNSMAVPVMRWIGRRIDAHVKGMSS